MDVRTARGSVWLTRKQLAELFGRDIKTIGKHIANAQREELAGLPVVAKFATTASDGKTYQVEHYDLDLVLSDRKSTRLNSSHTAEARMPSSA